MQRSNTTLLIFSLVASASGGLARADVSDEEPWDWPKIDVGIVGNHSDSFCQLLRDEGVKQPDLKCVIDHKTWDEHLKTELKKKKSDRDENGPWFCRNSAFTFFSGTSRNGNYPDGIGHEKPEAEFRAKVKVLECVWDERRDKPYVTYDPAAKKVTFHLTKGFIGTPNYAIDDFKKLKKDFPAINEYWESHQ